MILIQSQVPCAHTQAIRSIARKVLKIEFSKTAPELSISLVSEETIQKLNAQYRKKNKVTDVLSFPMDDGELLGDIMICVAQAKRQAKEIGHPLKRELEYLTVHGIYHLLGYDHIKAADAKRMRAKEKKIMGDL